MSRPDMTDKEKALDEIAAIAQEGGMGYPTWEEKCKAAEAKAAEQFHAASQLADAVVRMDAKVTAQAATIQSLDQLHDIKNGIIANLEAKAVEQTATIERLERRIEFWRSESEVGRFVKRAKGWNGEVGE